ncbi:beta-N-acetyl-D-glucosaminide beta-1,4-N-acetylglucosaminyl-transferase-like [Biomphalaria glabrata]|uniref:Beta-1,4-galactosyltransferase n=1 Tax=Biomphalaria glabrata TaxID=6526 RepID=A0A9U8DTZ0_BIOGL|nr:beta-N-acetyl-D-glucosaminide beta-1,4-N-acetylglucosaminyl-transferase-like [Biomphalaria glabrata]
MKCFRVIISYFLTYKIRHRNSFPWIGRNRICYLWTLLLAFFVLTALMLLDQGPEVSSDLERVILDFTDNQRDRTTLHLSVSSSGLDGASVVSRCADSPEPAGHLRMARDLGRRFRSRSFSMAVKPRLCPTTPKELVGRFSPELQILSPHEIAAKFPMMKDGGHYTPQSCDPIEKVAILIPYRSRWNNLHTLLPVLISVLTRQHVDFTIYVIEQVSGHKFNKGLMFNAGFIEAMNQRNFDCIILHDVDMVPVDDRNLYRCNKSSPLHFSSAVDKFNYSTLYSGLFGGVSCFTADHFRLVNGFSNMYFGWGAEDDDLRDRALFKNLSLFSKPSSIGAYNMLPHSGSHNWKKNSDRFKIYHKRLDRIEIDGLNSAKYKVATVAFFPIYTWLTIDIDENEVLETVPEHMRMDPTYTEDDSTWIIPTIPVLPE